MATAAVPSSNLLELVNCGLCLETYNDSNRLPKHLNCSHTFCLACVQRYYESRLNNKLPCPNCREVFTVPPEGVHKLKTNIMAVNLLDHLASFTSGDTDEGIPDMIAVPKEPGSAICDLHPSKNCMVSITKGPHKTHTKQKLRDVLTTYNTQHKDAVQLVIDMNIAGKQRAEELLEELVMSRDTVMKEATSKRDKAHQEADRWYQNTTATISKVYDKLHAQILQFKSKSDLQELQQSLEAIDIHNIDDDLKQAQSFLDQLQSSVISFRKSTIGPTKFWSVDVGKITDDFTVDLGCITEPTLKLPDVNSFPYTIEKMHENTKVDKPNSGNKQTRKPTGFRLLSDLPMEPGCHWSVGLTTNEAVVCFDGQSNIKNIRVDGNINQCIVLKQSALPRKISTSCRKYILNNNHVDVLLREYEKGPTFVLNSRLELVSTIQEDYGYIIGAHSTDWVAFCKNSGSTIKIFHLGQKQFHLLQTLRAPAGIKWWEPSICRHPDSQATAVVDDSSKSLCIYDLGRHLHTHELQFEVFCSNAIACNRRHLYVVSQDPVSVFVFSWSGQLVNTLDTQQLGIPEGQFICNIAVGDNRFTIAVGQDDTVSSFKTFHCL